MRAELGAAVAIVSAVAGGLVGGGPPLAQAQALTFERAVHPDSGLGEPQIAVDPRDPGRIVVGENDSGVAFSRDGGRTWARASLPNPGDNALAVEPDGSFVYTALDGDVRLSRDDGASWRTVGNWVGDVAAQMHELAPTGPAAVAGRELGCNAPEPEGPVATEPERGPGPQLIGCDRPWLTADPQTGSLYVSFTAHDEPSGGGWELGLAACRATVLTNPAFECGRQYVSASRDGGRSWSRFQPFDSPGYPAGGTGGFSSGPVAGGGWLATAYLASSVPSGRACPCVVFARSRGGTTWSRHVVPASPPPAALVSFDQTTLFAPYTAADPSNPRRYATMIVDAAKTHLLVYATEDGGRTWTGPAVLGEPGGARRYLPWIAYGDDGALGVIWRSARDDGSYTVWASVARRGDARFAQPVRLSSAPSPGPVSQLAGDDASDVTLAGGALHAVWGDRREGGLGVWYGRYAYRADPGARMR